MSFQKRQKLYLAAPLFNPIEREFNEVLAIRLLKFFDVFLPQRDGGLMANMIQEGIHPSNAARSVFLRDIHALKNSDVLLIVLDGRTVDEGAAFELGYSHALQKACYALQTDTRRLLPTGNNPMIEGACEKIFNTADDLIEWAAGELLPEPIRNSAEDYCK